MTKVYYIHAAEDDNFTIYSSHASRSDAIANIPSVFDSHKSQALCIVENFIGEKFYYGCESDTDVFIRKDDYDRVINKEYAAIASLPSNNGTIIQVFGDIDYIFEFMIEPDAGESDSNDSASESDEW